MCGLVAVINKLSNGFAKEQCDIFNDLLYVSALRGMDSTGAFLVTNENDLHLAKEATPAVWYRETKEFKEVLSKAFKNGTALVGHTRWATKGVVNDDNAHPFVVDDKITMVHNGTLYGDHKTLADTEVDSHAIAHVLSQEESVEKALQKLSGAYALIWHNFEKETINFVRNSQRPLFFMETFNGYYWASEESTLQWIKSRFNVKPTVDITSLKEGQLHTFKLGEKTVKREVTDVKLTNYTNNVVTYNNQQPWWNNTQHRHSNHYPHYYDDNNDYLNDNTPPFIPQIEPPVVKSEPVIVVATEDNSPRQSTYLDTEERKIAAGLNMNVNKSTFTRVMENYAKRTHFSANCIDYLEVIKGSGASGYFIFATMEEEPDILVRVYVPPDFTEEKALQWSVNQQKVLVKTKGCRWTQYPVNFQFANKWIIGGYGVLIGETIKPIRQVNLDNIESLV
jgi:hypothetical protein